ncbi:winged helix-turn-helix transcriptional regulator [Pontibacter qinzhouensis]|uniref:Winged helix-turn-helix transcriptional regulator n=1 Tax=Pontibacter qinzhouensis TaxID=2603253 RepID=A0A5C8J5V5_9BACT|nr:metalloregulator ArsR/SmtB family transcription factor [Pontibacter qinzhouensis]TXK31567.1 winged helix-turn-helix transcriptional regulator [Pontibacter qinzhouensis]
MGASKTELHTNEQMELAALAKALAHPARIAILQEMLSKRTCQCGELVTSIGLAQPTVSQHLKELKQAGLIKGSIEGAKICYCIDEANWQKCKQLFNGLFDEFIPLQNSCC